MHAEWHYEAVVEAEEVTDAQLERIQEAVRGVVVYTAPTKELRIVFRRSAYPADPVVRGYNLVALALTALPDSENVPTRNRLVEFRVRRSQDVV